jgi:pimeloyl-ACP methyl ester carboxylesterase
MRTFLTGLIGLLTVGASLYVLFCLLLYWRQESSIFFPVQNDVHLRQEFADGRVEIPVDGATLEGWWIDNPQATTQSVILYFGGNAEDVLYTASQAQAFDARKLLAMNYRGYGRSTGRPGQQALYSDALAIYDYAIGTGVRREDIVVAGRSLGSGIASMLAANRPVAAAILITPFDSLSAVAQRHYRYFPVGLLLRHPFPSSDWASQTTAPALFLAAEHDAIVPPEHARRLYDAWDGKKEFHLLPAAGHNDIERQPDYYRLIRDFLTRH